jgi:hypothetical protein
VLGCLGIEHHLLDDLAFFNMNLSGALNVFVYGYNTLFKKIKCRQGCLLFLTVDEDDDDSTNQDHNFSIYDLDPELSETLKNP